MAIINLCVSHLCQSFTYLLYLTFACLTMYALKTSPVFQTIEETFNETVSNVSWIGSAIAGGRLLLGPMAALMVNKLGFKVTGCMGAILTPLVMVGCYFSPNSMVFAILYGGVWGVVLAFLYFPGTLTISSHDHVLKPQTAFYLKR